MSAFTVQLPDTLRAALDEVSRRQDRTAEEVARDMIEKALFLERFDQMRAQMQPFAQAAGFSAEEAIFRAVS